MKKKNAKFKVGQVVWIRGKNQTIKISNRNWQGRWYYWKNDSSSVGFDERDLRGLTKREKGDS